MMLVWILFVAVLIVGAALLFRALIWGNPRTSPKERPHSFMEAIRILEERYARGEIDRNEFEERRRILRT